jgi:fucose permease
MGWFASREETSAVFLLFLSVGFSVDLYLIFVAYLVWFRFSPRAVRHFSAVLTIVVLSYVLDVLRGQVGDGPVSDHPWYGYFMIGGLFLGFWAWVFLHGLLNGILFPLAPVTALSNSQNESQSANEIDDQRAARP